MNSATAQSSEAHLLRQLIDAAADAMLLVDRSGRIRECNQRALDVLGYGRDELIGESVDRLVPEALEQAHAAYRDSYLGNMAPRPMGLGRDLHARTRSGDLVPMEISLTPLDTAKETLIVVAMRDIRVRRQAEATRAERDAAIRDRELAEDFSRIAVSREERIGELMREVNALADRLGDPPPYFKASDGSQDETLASKPNTEDAADPIVGDAPPEQQSTQSIKEDFARLLHEERIQALFTDYCESLGIASAIIDLEGNVLTAARWQRCCTDFHRVDKDSCANCIESDTDLALNLKKGEEFAIYRCKNGMTDCASPIIVEGQHVANVFIGQFHLQAPDLGFFSQQANTFGYDESDYLDAIRAAPVMDEARLPSILSFLSGFARLIGNMAMETRLARRMENQANERAESLRRERGAAIGLADDADRARQQLEHLKAGLEQQIEERTEALREREQILAGNNRDLNTLTLVNEAVMKSVNEEQLLYEVCRQIVEANDKLMAWVGLADFGPEKDILVASHYGYQKGYLEGLKLSWNPTDRALDPSGKAIRNGSHTLINDIEGDPDFEPWRVAAMERGYRSVISVPLLNQGDAFGVINVYAAETKGFDEKNVEILQRVADSISYGVIALRAEQARKQAEAESHRQRALLNAVLDAIPDPVFHKDMDGHYVLANPAVSALHARPMERIIGHDDFDLFGQTIGKQIQEDDQAMLQSGESRKVEEWVTYPDGRQVLQQSLKAPLRNAGGELLGMLGISRDITQLDESRTELANQLAISQALLDEIPYPIFYKDADCRFLGFNRAYEEAFQVDRNTLIGKRVLDLEYLPEADRIRYQAEDEKVIAECGRASHKMTMPYADGREHRTLYSVQGFRLPDGSPGGLIGTFVDITDITGHTPTGSTEQASATPEPTLQARREDLSREDLEAAFNAPESPSDHRRAKTE